MQKEIRSALGMLEEKVDKFEGLEEVRMNIHAFIRLLQAWKAEEEEQIEYSPVPLHFIFSGEAGTGRTQAAELMGEIYHVLGYLTEGKLIEAEARELEESEVQEKAIGNVLLLTNLSGLNQERIELLETLMNTHQENIAVMLKGTPQEVEELLEAYPKLRIRFCKSLYFADQQEREEAEKIVQEEQKAHPEVTEKFPALKFLDADTRTGMLLRPGARMDLTAYTQDELRIRLVYKKLKLPMEMDAYVFLLHEDEMTRYDEEMIFFGNLISQDNGAAVVEGTRYPETAFILNRIYQEIQKIAICFSAYGDNAAFDFSQIEKPVLQVFHGEEQIAWMDLQNLKTERTLVAAELYRYQNTWKIRAVSAGYRDGLAQLCQRYGIEVE